MISKGKWEISNPAKGLFNIFEKSRGSICMITSQSAQEMPEDFDNAKLIAEAGTVANETGYTPRQLADQKADLLDALKCAVILINANTLLDAGSPLSIKLKAAIAKATE